MKLHITKDHTGKMKGMQSVSSSCMCNSRCAKNAKVEGSVCQKCYAMRQMKMYKKMQPIMEQNYNLLTNGIIPEEELPILNCAFFRIEAFGDIANVNHAINYLNLIRKNPHVFFGWWTKNPDLLDKAFKKTGYEKPANVNIIRSSMFINKPVKPYYWFVDKTFTVYDKATIAEKGVEINCGARSCLTCHKCYEKNGITEVREKLK